MTDLIARGAYQIDVQEFYQIYSDFPGCGEEAFLVPPQTEYSKQTVIDIGAVCLRSDPPVFTKTPPYDKDFTLSWVDTCSVSSVKLRVTVKDTQWQCEADVRKRIRGNFAKVAVALDELEYPTKGAVLVPGATRLILRRVAEVMVAPLTETLFYLCGFNTGVGSAQACPYVDLVPGMRVVVHPEINQFVGVGSAMNRPITTGAFTMDVCGVTGAGGGRRIAFDAFLGAISAPMIANKPVGPGRPQFVIGGLLDLQAAGVTRRHWRLFYPIKLPAADTQGDVQLGNSVTFVGADTWADLDAATVAYQSGNPAQGVTAPLVYAVLRGRPTVVPQVPVAVNDALEYVSVGTTVRDIVGCHVLSNPLVWNKGKDTSQQFAMFRSMTFTGEWLPTEKSVEFNPRSTEFSDPRAYDLPIVLGDRVEVKRR